MSLRDSFNQFAPLSDTIDPAAPFGFQLDLVAIRARELLNKRNEKQITDALDTLSWVLEEGRQLQEQTALNALDDESDRDSYVLTDTNALRLYMPYFDIQGQSSFPNATWPEYFAILALAQIGAAQDESGGDLMKETLSSIGVDPETVTSQREILRLDYLLQATEAVATAELMAEKQSTHQQKSKKGGTRRAAKYDELKSFVFSKWEDSFQHLSNRQAAKKIWPLVPDNLKGLLTTDDQEHRLEEWIGRQKNNIEKNEHREGAAQK
ncbi:MAG: hypothetical protein OQL20_01685 [Sedimenticola sp.]|nr:hypothetical protein [Sedimenticola sp.]